MMSRQPAQADVGYYYWDNDIILCTYIQNFQII